ncbi:Tim10/DDP family zinc finger-domain-containing protein [Limtongia smithiae]|uniref:Tim10/DDP family zinc finger-domain-containing protein n=1 Tax=Limtongia smithiae TaxID=1125753 RepID=UPI0034CEAE8A
MAFSLFGGNTGTAPASTLSPQAEAVKEQLRKQVVTESSIANAQELISKISLNCFDLCISTPGSSLSPEDQKCLGQCAEKYMQAWNLVSREYTRQVQEMSRKGQI